MPASPLDQIKELERYITHSVAALDIDVLDRSEQKLIVTLKRQLIDAKLDIRDHEFADSKAEQTKLAKAAYKSLDTLRANILAASERNLFGAIDVAVLSTKIEGISAELA